MYYLLEDNRIIDSNNKEDIELLRRNRRIIENEKIVYYCGNFLKNKQCMNCSHWNCIKCQYAKKDDDQIKNQSENVFDFIDKKKDLVKIDGQIIMARTIQGDIKNLSGISAIYKPNEKGDYIKVWEKKDE